MRVFVANVGANKSTAPKIRSPIFPDRAFELVPIREEFPGTDNPTYMHLRSWTGRAPDLATFVHPTLHGERAHADPEFEAFTYGDVYNGRSAALFSADAGDLLLFAARLWDYGDGEWGDSDFYFVAKLLIAQVVVIAPDESLDGVTDRVGASVAKRLQGNANYRRVVAGERARTIIIVGAPAGSCLLSRALRVDRDVSGLLYGGAWDPTLERFIHAGQPRLNKSGRARSLASFGSATRSIQSWLRSGRDDEYLEKLLARINACV